MFRLLTDLEILARLGPGEIAEISAFGEYLGEIREAFHGFQSITISEAYNTAWRLGFVDFKEPFPNLYNIDFNEEVIRYRSRQDMGLRQTAKIEWLATFNAEIEFPTDKDFWSK